ncbi:MAG: hypothetical protein ACOCYE_01955 [Pseudomonadota bacterium]
MRVLARLFLGLAVLGAGAALWAGWRGAPLLGELWFELHPFSLNLTQAIVQRYLHPDLWDRVLLPLLFQPTALVAGVAALGFAALAWLLRRRLQ